MLVSFREGISLVYLDYILSFWVHQHDSLILPCPISSGPPALSMASHGLSQPFQRPKITTWWNTPNAMQQQHLPHSFRQVLGSQMISSNLHFLKSHAWREKTCNTKRNNPNLYVASYLSFNNCKCVLSRKVVPYLMQTWNMWLKLSRSSISTKNLWLLWFCTCHNKTLYWQSHHLRLSILPDLEVNTNWSWCHHVPQCGPTPGLRQGSQRFLEAHPPWLGDLSNARMKCHHTTPRDLPSRRSFLGHPAQVSYVHRISCLSLACLTKVHQTSAFEFSKNVDVWQLQS